MSAPKLYWDDLHVGLRFLSGTAIVDADDLKQFATMFIAQFSHVLAPDAHVGLRLVNSTLAAAWHERI